MYVKKKPSTTQYAEYRRAQEIKCLKKKIEAMNNLQKNRKKRKNESCYEENRSALLRLQYEITKEMEKKSVTENSIRHAVLVVFIIENSRKKNRCRRRVVISRLM